MKKPEEQSDFGTGFAYCLGLFLAHADNLNYWIDLYKKIRIDNNNNSLNQSFVGDLFTEQKAVEMWALGAGDHMIDFDPEAAPKNLRKRCNLLQDKVFELKNSYVDFTLEKPESYARQLIDEAKEILREYDIHLGINALKATYN